MKQLRYFVRLMWHWSIPFLLGFAVSMALWTWNVVEMSHQFEAAFKTAIGARCGANQ